MEKDKKRWIKWSITVVMVFIIVICIFAVYFVSILKEKIYQDKLGYLSEVSSKAVDIVQTKVHDNFVTMQAIATFIGNDEIYDEKKVMRALTKEAEKNEFKRMGVISPDGHAVTTDNNPADFGEREYFKKALAGDCSVSDTLIDLVDGEKINVFAAPVIQNGKVSSVVFATKSLDEFSKLLSVKSFGGEGYSYMIKKDGTPVINTKHKNGFSDYENLFDVMYNTSEDISVIEEFKQNLSDGKNGVFRYTRDDVAHEICYESVGVNDWYLVSSVPTNIVFKNSDALVLLVLLCGGFVLIGALYLCYLMFLTYKHNSKNLQAVAYTDPVTGYSNWNKFSIDCDELFKKNPEKQYAMIIFDIERFKVINDVYGHLKGNEILKEIAVFLSKNTDSFETFARTSSDNFNILMNFFDDETIIERINKICKMARELIEGYPVLLTFGIYKVVDEFPSVSALSDRASIAKLQIKGRADTRYNFFSEKTRDLILEEGEIESCMEASLKNGEFEMYLQPKFSFQTERIVGAEALSRWNRPDKGLVPPDNFIPLFERNGFIRKLDENMFERVCILLKKWADSGVVTQIPISVNLSRVHLSSDLLSEKLVGIAKKHGVNPQLIEIEITESAVFGDTKMLIRIMTELKKAGFLISIDDFGSGYSSLNTLKDMPTDVIKMDKGFLDEATDNDRAKLIITSLIQMTKGLGLSTVAEGVETIEQVEFLRNAGCDKAQGYYYAKPMPIKSFEALLDDINGAS